MRKRLMGTVGIIIGCVLIILASVIVYFYIPYSPLNSEYKDICQKIEEGKRQNSEVLLNDNIESLPSLIQKYIVTNGYIGSPIVNSMQIEFLDADFILNRGDSPIKINYYQINEASEPNRIALIDTSMYGIPFQGLDKYMYGDGTMRGVLAKNITLFNQGGKEFNISSLITYLSESILMPSILINESFQWEEIDDYNVKVSLKYYDEEVSGVFTFDDSWKVISFKTNQRTMISTDGEINKIPWEVKYLNYKKDKSIIKPTEIQAIWHYNDQSSIYFDGIINDMIYN
ncbi:DUF6544 family protein [Miniphocaeibacter halophilus]|uniref:Uncharacterized protein n=1 Tax=Miniphocaeibacter halophilus TaxID=2931922 RepID=A0AC61MTS4_9FIRM|nr:DUF6544 family protein [Miniphocaeibacter halophilus]QQK09027.1 hypothetical protein JFY71_05680 [Miniphocaeibacter halophilus]